MATIVVAHSILLTGLYLGEAVHYTVVLQDGCVILASIHEQITDNSFQGNIKGHRTHRLLQETIIKEQNLLTKLSNGSVLNFSSLLISKVGQTTSFSVVQLQLLFHSENDVVNRNSYVLFKRCLQLYKKWNVKFPLLKIAQKFCNKALDVDPWIAWTCMSFRLKKLQRSVCTSLFANGRIG